MRDYRGDVDYDRFDLGPGALGWVYRYRNAHPVQSSGVANGLEFGVQVAGEWLQRVGARSHVYAPGEIYRLSPAEAYDQSFSRPRDGAPDGIQVGFIVYQEEITDLASTDGALRFARPAGVADPMLVDLCRSLAYARDGGASVGSCDITGVLRAFLARHAVLEPADRLTRARREIDRSLPIDMSIGYFADVAGLHPESFTRLFKKRFGATPARYRLVARLNQAARLAWSRLDWSIDRVGYESGFPDAPYFHRAFRGHFGCTPAEWAGRRARFEEARPAA